MLVYQVYHSGKQSRADSPLIDWQEGGLWAIASWNSISLAQTLEQAYLTDRPLCLVNPKLLELPVMQSAFQQWGFQPRGKGLWHAPAQAKILRGLHSGFQLILLSSGTSGRPKLVCLDRQSIEFNVQSICSHLGLQKLDPYGILVQVPLFHAFGAVLCLLHGIIRQQPMLIAEKFSMDQFLTFLQEHQTVENDLDIQQWFLPLVPSLLPSLNHMIKSHGMEPNLQGMAIVGGDRVRAMDYNELQQTLPGVSFSIGYGCTEAGPALTHTLPGKIANYDGWIGSPLPGIQMKADDDGTWCFQSPGQCAAIWSEKNAYWQASKDDWLATGDQLSIHPGGDLQFIDRRKWVIKRQGEAFSPQTLEDHLRQMLGDDSEIAVVGWSDAKHPNRDRLAVILSDLVDQKKIKLACDVLPTIMQPDLITAIPYWPRNALGKLERQELIRFAQENFQGLPSGIKN